MIIVGLTGGIGYGKTTFAGMLAARARAPQHFESWQLISEVAEYIRQLDEPHPAPDDVDAINRWLMLLPEAALTCVHASVHYEAIKITPERLAKHPEYYQKLFEYLQLMRDCPELITVELTVDTKEQFRGLLQWLGGYLVAVVGTGIWYDEILRRIAYLQTTGCDLVTVGGVRYPGDAERLRNAGGMIIEIKRPSQPLTDNKDLTERDRDLIRPDATVINNSNLEALQQLANSVMADLNMHELRPEYLAPQPVTELS